MKATQPAKEPADVQTKKVPKRIRDQFTGMAVERQVRYQLRQRAAHRCEQCSGPTWRDKRLCLKDYVIKQFLALGLFWPLSDPLEADRRGRVTESVVERLRESGAGAVARFETFHEVLAWWEDRVGARDFWDQECLEVATRWLLRWDRRVHR